MEETDIIPPPRPAHRLVFHSALNAAGQGIPLAAAFVAVPLLVKALGTERFGLLTLSWAVIGYTGLFDLGLGRALTQLIAERRADSDHALTDTIWSALTAMLLLGLVGGIAMFLAAPWLAERAVVISPALSIEARRTCQLLAIGIPVVVLTASVRGILEAYERFDLVNAVRVPTGVSTFLGPLVVAPFSPTLPAAVAALLVARTLALVAQAIMVWRAVPIVRRRAKIDLTALGSVVRFGAWITVSNVLSPLMSSADRFFIGNLLSASVVAYYTAPYEMVTRVMGLVAVAVATSLFPAFARWRGAGHASGLFRRGLRLTWVAFVPLMVGIVVFAHPILAHWLGADFADHGTTVLRILGCGVLVNGLAQVPFAHIQAVGRADLTAKIHIAEVPAYFALLVLLIRAKGIEGAALAWSLRVAVDAALMFAVSRRLLRVVPAAPPASEMA